MKHISHNAGDKRGFTIVETLVAIAILMIAIAGPLVVANKAFTAAINAKDQSIASFLAQEGMELVRNVKDTAIYNDPAGGFAGVFNGLNSTFGNCTSSTNACGIWLKDGDNNPGPGGSVSTVPCSLVNSSCLLYMQSSGSGPGYVNASSGSGLTPTIFTRSFFKTFPDQANINEVQVTVVVSWTEGTVPNAVTVSSEMTAASI